MEDKQSFKHIIKMAVLKPAYIKLRQYFPDFADHIRLSIYGMHGNIELKGGNSILKADNRRKIGVLVDLTQISRTNPQTGIQRVVNNVFQNMLRLVPSVLGVRDLQGKLITSNKYFVNAEGKEFVGNEQEVISKQGDTLLLLDSSWEFSQDFSTILDNIHNNGGHSYSVVYDFFPVQYPELFAEAYFKDVFSKWHKMVLEKCDGIICISKTTADVAEWYFQKEKIKRQQELRLYSFPMGFNLKVDKITERDDIKNFVEKKTTFLMVGTVEPRKGHMVVIKALKKLVASASDVQLLIIGQDGWKNDEIKTILTDEQIKDRILWVKDATDEELQWCYVHCTALIAASKDEGYGLPLIEAAHYGLPIICSDIPVFREVAGGNATYFQVMNSDNLGETIITWLQEEQHPNSKNIKIYTWEESAQTILDILNNKIKPYKILQ